MRRKYKRSETRLSVAPLTLILQKQMRILLFTLLLFSARLSAQPYRPFIEENTWWDEFYAPEYMICKFDSGTRSWFSGDTVIQGVVWKKVCSSMVFSEIGVPFCPPYSTDTTMRWLSCCLREDTSAKRIYQIDLQGNETLLYNFSMQPGDTMIYGVSDTIFLDSIGSMMTNDGLSRRVFYFKNAVKWIEGIGNPNGFNVPWAGLCICQRGLCFVKKGAYVFGEQSICTTVSATNEWSQNFTPPEISPNPVRDFIRVKAGEEWENLEVYSASGGQSFSVQLHGGTNTLQSNQMPRGFFYFVFTRNDGLRLTKTVCRQ